MLQPLQRNMPLKLYSINFLIKKTTEEGEKKIINTSLCSIYGLFLPSLMGEKRENGWKSLQSQRGLNKTKGLIFNNKVIKPWNRQPQQRMIFSFLMPHSH